MNLKKIGIACVAGSIIAAVVLQAAFGALADPPPPGMPSSTTEVINGETVHTVYAWSYPNKNWPLILILLGSFLSGVCCLVVPSSGKATR